MFSHITIISYHDLSIVIILYHWASGESHPNSSMSYMVSNDLSDEPTFCLQLHVLTTIPWCSISVKSTYIELTWPPLVFKWNKRTKQDNDRWTAMRRKEEKQRRLSYLVTKGRDRVTRRKRKDILTEEDRTGFMWMDPVIYNMAPTSSSVPAQEHLSEHLQILSTASFKIPFIYWGLFQL